jgi:Putative beta-barrel porin 2
MRNLLLRPALIGFGASLGALPIAPEAIAANTPREPGDAFTLSLSEQVTHDDNLYRLPPDIEIDALMPGAEASRDDLVSRTSALIDGQWDLGKQAFLLNAAIDSNRYADNDRLNNTSATGRADWNWQLGEDWTGQIGAGYSRALAGFVNSRFLGKDLLETLDYHGAIRFQLTPHWSLSGKGRLAEGAHDADAREADNFGSQSSTFGIQYLTGRGDEFGLQYRRTHTTFPDEILGGGPFGGRDYVDRAATFEASYAFTVKTSFQGSAGYVWRHYPQSVLGDFAGPTWNASLRWEPRAKTRIELAQWQELKAYLDAESNHFESRGTRLTFAWLPTTRITLSLEASRENHDYTGFDPGALTQSPRRDRIQAQQAALRYAAAEYLTFDVTCRFEQRDTNRPLFQYDDRAIGVGLTLIF